MNATRRRSSWNRALGFAIASAIVATAAPALAIDADERSEDEAQREHARFAWWHRQRSSPLSQIEPGALLRARTHMAALPRAGGPAQRDRNPAPGPPTPPDAFPWSFLGPANVTTTQGAYETPNMGPEAGRASALVIDPTNPATLYAGYSAGGVWKSTDGGATWRALGDQQASLAIGSIALDPSDPQTVYVGTGEGALFDGFYGAGILRSSDGGDTWTTLGASTFSGVAIPRLLVDPTTGDLYAGTVFGVVGTGDSCDADTQAKNQGVYRSTDHGTTWAPLLLGDITDLEIDFTSSPPHLFVVDFEAGVKRSVDGGQTWLGSTGLPAMMKEIGLELALAPTNPQIVYAGVGEDGGTLYVSQDGGATFVKTPGSPKYCEAQCYWDDAVIVDPADPATVWLGGSLCGVWKTTNALDAAPTWTNVSALFDSCGVGDSLWYRGNVHPDVHALAIEPGNSSVFYAATDGGIARTSDGGTTWERLNNGVGTLQLYNVCLDPADVENMYGGAQDNGSSRRSGDPVWAGISSGDGGYCAVNVGDSNNVLVTDYSATVFRSTDRFVSAPQPVFSTYNCAPGAVGCGDRASFIAPLITDPSTAGTFYVGTYRLYRSTDTGSTWAAVSDDLTLGAGSVPCGERAHMEDDTLTAIAVAPGAPSTLYTGSAGGVVSASFDGGATWSRVSKSPLPARWVSDIAVDPRDDKRLFVAFSGFDAATPTTPGHVFMSTDGGATFTKLDTGVDAPVDTLVQHPVARGLLYAGTDVGVLVTTDSGASWAALGDSTLPNSPVFSLRFHEKGGRLVAGTHGRGAWGIDFGPGSLAAAPASLAFTAVLGGDAPAPRSFAVTDADPYGSVASFDVAVSEPWLDVTPTSGTTAGSDATTVRVTPNLAGLALGEHDATITLTPKPGTAGGPKTVAVRFTVTDASSSSSSSGDASTDVQGGGCGCGIAGSSHGAGAGALIALALLARRRQRRAGSARRATT